MYKLMYQDDLEYSDFVFLTKEDAEFYLTFDSDLNKPTITEVPVFSRKFWYSLTPYVFWFDGDGNVATGKVAKPIHVYGMMDSQFVITKFPRGKHTMVAFWDSTTDIAQAEVLAKSIYEGWRTANELQSNVS